MRKERPAYHECTALSCLAEVQVRALTAKLLDIHALLGSRPDIDVASMIISCPG